MSNDSDVPLPALFTPFTIRSVTFANRIIVSPMCQYAAEDGNVGRWHRAHHGRFALGGVGGALVESTGVTRDGRITPGCTGLWDDAHIEGLREIVALYHDQSTPIGIQLSHAGRKASAAVPLKGSKPLATSDPAQAWTIVGPSAIPLTVDWPVPEALDEPAILDIVEAFAAAATRAVVAGFDFVEIHGAHGYLINSFVSPVSNRRDDAWGGDRDGRFRLAITIAQRLRATVADTMPLFYRHSSVDGVDGGITIADSVALACALKAAGVDLIDCSSGGITGASGRAALPPHPGYLVPFADQIRREAKIATMAVGLIVDPAQADDIITNGCADLVAMGRQMIAEPQFAHRAAIALGHPDPNRLLPESYAFFLDRRKMDER